MAMTQTPFRRLADDFFVAPQLTAEDFAAARAQGIRMVINNRPDGEAPDQLSDAEARALAEAHGLAYVHVPVVLGSIQPDSIRAFARAVADNPGPYLAYCRSGTRSCHMWAFAEAPRRPAGEILEAAASAGYDLGPALPLLRRFAAQG
jgi:sulfide:quinone oxidoreductase